MKNPLATVFGRQAEEPDLTFGWEFHPVEPDTVSEPLPWHSGEAYPEQPTSMGGREVVQDWSFGSREVG
jgi:hypothetical protein